MVQAWKLPREGKFGGVHFYWKALPLTSYGIIPHTIDLIWYEFEPDQTNGTARISIRSAKKRDSWGGGRSLSASLTVS